MSALTIYDDRFARWQSGSKGPAILKRTFAWGQSTKIVGGRVEIDFEGVSNTLLMINSLGGGPMRLRSPNEQRYPNQGFSCIGCPHFGMDEYRQTYCAHPMYLELYNCPQFKGRVKGSVDADSDCPMLGRRSEVSRRRVRQHHKWHYIFWRYYHDTNRNPWREGFACVDAIRYA